MSNVFIKAEHLAFSYEETKNSVIKDVSFEINLGEYVAIIGHNGSGKSTLAKLLNMILIPTYGKIYVDGKDITSSDMSDEDIYTLRRNVGMVFQNPDNQLVAAVVEEDVAFGPENLGVPSNEIRERVNHALNVVGMKEFAKYDPSRLSGGQKQRVAIAGLIAMLPKCMIFDESTAMLDPNGRKEVMDTIEHLNRDLGITTVIITHNMDEAARADRIIVLNDGEIFLDGTPKEVFASYRMLNSIGLSVPQCTELMQRIKSHGIDVLAESVTPDECVDELIRILKK